MKFKSRLLNQYLKEKRLESGMTQAEVARALGYTPQFVANWERDACSPPAQVLAKLVRILRIPENEILTLLHAESLAFWEGVIRPKAKVRVLKRSGRNPNL